MHLSLGLVLEAPFLSRIGAYKTVHNNRVIGTVQGNVTLEPLESDGSSLEVCPVLSMSISLACC